jgi:hypothetical protein
MTTGRIKQRSQDLIQFLRPDRTETAADHRIRILRFSFESTMPDISNPKDDQTIVRDAAIGENLHFEYPVLVPADWRRGSSCILLLLANPRQLNRVFSTMILPDLYREERESGFQRMKNRMAGVALCKDRVFRKSADFLS